LLGNNIYNKYYKDISQIDKYYYICFDSTIIFGTLLICYSLCLCCAYGELDILRIRFFFIIGANIFTLGNCFNFGNLFIEYFLFKGLKCELLPPKYSPHNYEVIGYYQLYERTENDQSLAEQNADEHEQSRLVGNISANISGNGFTNIDKIK